MMNHDFFWHSIMYIDDVCSIFAQPRSLQRLYEVFDVLKFTNLIVDISKSYDTAVSALAEHKTQIPKADNYYFKLYDARTRLRGVQAACERGEAFTIHLPEHAGPFYSENSTDLLL